jgi:hypothetical protein
MLMSSIVSGDLEFEKIAKVVAMLIDQIAKMTAAYTDALGITDPNVREGHVYATKPGQTTQEYLDEKAKHSAADTPAAAPGGPRQDAPVKEYLNAKTQSDDEAAKFAIELKKHPEYRNEPAYKEGVKQLEEKRSAIADDVKGEKFGDAKDKTDELRSFRKSGAGSCRKTFGCRRQNRGRESELRIPARRCRRLQTAG